MISCKGVPEGSQALSGISRADLISSSFFLTLVPF
uniref:Uncharacterized protein n=1 Tax=Anguilla anguilla TaxID=7936 RepID=A0A0E9WF02_ANGAN